VAALAHPARPARLLGEGGVPRMPQGFRVEIDKDGWRH